MTKLREKAVLAYSGDLDTTAIIPWLREHLDYEVICCCVDCGQDNEFGDLEECAELVGASKLYLLNEGDSFADNYIPPCLQAGLDTKQAALLSNTLSRPLITQKLVELARKEHAVMICHGATGKDNDQVRFELSVKAFASELKIIAPWRVTKLQPLRPHEDGLIHCRQEGIDLPFDVSRACSCDRNLQHSSHEDLELEDPAREPIFEELLRLSVSPRQASDTGALLRIGFEEGVSVSPDGKRMKFSDLLYKLNEIGGEDGIDIFDIIEDRVIGMKVHGIYKVLDVAILLEVKQSLEAPVLNGDTLATKHSLGEKYASFFCAGKWFTPPRETLQAFFANAQNTVSGEIKLRLYKGNLIRTGAGPVFLLYAEDVVSFTIGFLYHHRDADGLIALFGLPLELRARVLQHADVTEEESALVKLPASSLPIKTTVSRVRKVDKKQVVGKITEKKKSDEKTSEKEKTVKEETVRKIAKKKTGAKKVTRKALKKAPEKK